MASCFLEKAKTDYYHNYRLSTKRKTERCILAETMTLDCIRMPFTSGRGTVRLSAEVVLPIGLVPGMILLAAVNPFFTAAAFVCTPALAYYLSAKFKSRNPRTPCFLVWALCTAIFLLAVMELEVIPYMEIYLWENIFLKVLVAALLACVYVIRKIGSEINSDQKALVNGNCQQTNDADPETLGRCAICNFVQSSRSFHCRYCGTCVVQRDHHCFWIDTCIGARNHRMFLLGLLLLICANYYGAMLTLTTVCQPIFICEWFLVPSDCSGVYDDIHIAVCFVSAIYSLLIAAAGVCSLIKQMYLVSLNLTMEEWRRSKSVYNSSVEPCIRRSHSKGVFYNWYIFLRGQR